MLQLSDALIIANQKLRSIESDTQSDYELKLINDLTITTEFGWVFFYNTKVFLETGDFSYGLVGNSPFIVDKSDGSVHQTGTSRPIEFYIEEYRKR